MRKNDWNNNADYSSKWEWYKTYWFLIQGENSAVKEGNTVLEAMSGYPATTEDSLGSDDFESNQEAHVRFISL